MLGRHANFTKTVSASGRVAPKRPASLSVSPVAIAETDMDVGVEESVPVSVGEFGPTSAEEGVVRVEAHPSFAFQSRTPISHLEAGVLRVFVAVEFHWAIAKLTRRRRRQNRYRLSVWTLGSAGNRRIEHTTHFQRSSCGTARVKAFGVTRCRRRV